MNAATQGGIVLANTSPGVAVYTPCPCDALDLWSLAHTFTFQYVDPNLNNQPVGAAISAEAISATDFKLTITAPRNAPWQANTQVGVIVGTAADPIQLNPRRIS
jgi:hypothetical protein